ncbi:hypothetical protein Gotri_011619 [Gossypium trilobum]|uniref:RNase H type-1 domain-containing protein n=1 Tax=Gossypium trilobum TaxID=34281 RepID=A0A7J9EVB7_9ROSI|nr:hypothetical protein [Gossypium trilobum]
MMVTWSVWFHRNLYVWQDSNVSPASIIEFANKYLQDWKNSLLAFNRVQKHWDVLREASNRWIRPDNGRVKCNYDASVSIDDNATTYVVVLRDNTGNFVKGYTSFSHTKMEPHMVEGVVIQEALSWLKSLNLDRVVTELDCLKVILT